MKAPILTGQCKTVYDYIENNSHITIDKIRKATLIKKPCMRCSEINQTWRLQNGLPIDGDMQIVITVGRNKHNEALKAIALL